MATLSEIGRLILFLLRFAIAGLAIAFVAVVIKPDLLGLSGRRAPTAAEVKPADAAAPATAAISYAKAVERSAASVVNIFTVRLVEQSKTPSAQGIYDEFTPKSHLQRSLGSGVIIDAQGHIVTNNHVISEATSIMVQLADGRSAEARVVGRDYDTDIAVLKITLGNLPVMPLGHSNSLRVGDVVLTIGNPVGLTQTVTQGIVSAIGRGLGVATFENFIQTDAAINVGNSGGALINSEGELIGINTAVASRSAGIEGIGFAIPVNLVRGVMDEIMQKGRVVRGWLGVVPSDLPAGQPSGEAGVLVSNLYMDSPAYRAGLHQGDVITHLNETKITSRREALAFVAKIVPGQSLRIRGLRNGSPFEITAKVEERPNRSSSQ